jgi:hypothetical protein
MGYLFHISMERSSHTKSFFSSNEKSQNHTQPKSTVLLERWKGKQVSKNEIKYNSEMC